MIKCSVLIIFITNFCYSKAYFLYPESAYPIFNQSTNGQIRFDFFINYTVTNNVKCSGFDQDEDNKYIFRFLICPIKKGCEDRFKSIEKKLSDNCLNPDDDMAVLKQSNVSECKDYAPTEESFKYTLNTKESVMQIPNYYGLISQTLFFKFLFDKDYTLFCINGLVEESVNKDYTIPDQITKVLTTLTYQCFVLAQIKYQYTCENNYKGPKCEYLCESDNRRNCANKVYDKEECLKGWALLTINLTITNNNNCGIPFKKSVIISRCLIINACEKHDVTPCNRGYECIPEYNNTYICATYNHYYTNPNYTSIKNFSRIHVMNNDTITLHVDEVKKETYSIKVYTAYWQHDKDISIETNTSEKREEKNQQLIISKNNLTIKNEKDACGCDYAVNAVIKPTGKNAIVYKIVYCIINIPTVVTVSNLIYVHYSASLNLSTNGCPHKYMRITLSRRDINYTITFVYSERFLFPAWSAKLFILELAIIFNSYDGLKETFFSKSHHSTKAYDEFYWDISDYILKKENTLTCVFKGGTNMIQLISQISGADEINNTLSDEFQIKDFKPGEYIVACIVDIDKTKESFYRYKMFELHKPPVLCILPFPPAIGVLVKCFCIVFPPGEDTYKMILIDNITQNVILRSSNNYIRIPYLLFHNKKYTIRCDYEDIYNNEKVNLNTSVHFELNEHSEILAMNFDKECMEYGSLPEEYMLKESIKTDLLIFYNQLFYLKASPKFYYNIPIFFFAVFFNYLMIYIIANGYEKNPQKKFAETYLHAEKAFKRNLMRRINNKITNISCREIDTFKHLIGDFRAKNISTAILSNVADESFSLEMLGNIESHGLSKDSDSKNIARFHEIKKEVSNYLMKVDTQSDEAAIVPISRKKGEPVTRVAEKIGGTLKTKNK